MTRDEVLNVVVKHLKANVDNLSGVEIDPQRSLADYGASSLDILEIVAGTMRDLKIKIPRTELRGLTNINGFVDKLLSVVVASRS